MQAIDVVVVGGGLAGLTAAAVAAGDGARVAVLEARSAPGGRARSDRSAGFVRNEGAHALYLDGEARSILEGLGVRTPGWVPPAAGSLGLADGRLGLLPVDGRSLLRTTLLGWRGKVDAGRMLAALPRLDPAALAGRTVDDWLDGAVGDPAARRLVHAVVRVATYCDAPDRLDAGAALTQVQRSLHGSVRYLDGGWQHLVDQLAALAAGRGATIRADARVVRVRRGPAGGVEVDVAGGMTIDAAAVILAGGGPRHAAGVLGDLGGDLERLAAATSPSTVSALDICLDVPWGDAPRFVLGVDEPLYLSLHGPGAGVAPSGGSLVSLLRYHRAGAADEPLGTRDRLEAVLDDVRPGWRDHVVADRFLRHAVVSHDVPRAASRGLGARPTVGGTGVPGVLVAGDWVGPLGLLSDAAVASGAEAGRTAARIASSAGLAA